MTVPNDDGFVGASVTEDQFKQNLVQLLDHIRSLTSGFDLKNGKVYDFASMLDFEAIKTKIPAGSIVVIEWGEEYGAYVWDGANLTKSQYDLLALAKSDATTKAATAKSEAISAAANDASTKSQAAETNAKQAAENNDVKLLLALQQIIQTISDNRIELDQTDAALNAEDQLINTRVTRLLLALQQLTQIISENRIELDAAITTLSSNSTLNENSTVRLNLSVQKIVETVNQHATELVENFDGFFDESKKLERLYVFQQLAVELSKLNNFDPDASGSNKYVEAEKIVFFPVPTNVIRIDLLVEGNLPTAKGTVKNTLTTMNVDGQVISTYGTLEVQGSSSAGFPKKNWTLCLFSDDARTTAIKIKLGNMIVQEELVWKANFVDNTHARNLAVNRLYDQMQLSRVGFPKREVDAVNMLNADLSVENYNGLTYMPSGATGHVDGFQTVIYINDEFYGIGSLNIGKKRDNYNLDKNNQKHIQLEPGGGVNLYALPLNPLDPPSTTVTTAAFEIRRPSSWKADAQASYERFRTFLSMSRTDMQNAGIDNYINRAQMQDYIILCQVCDLWDHLHKNTLYTTWDGLVWSFMPYDLDTVFGLHFLGNYFDENGNALHPATALRVPSASANNNWGTLAKFRLIYGTDIDARYAALRKAKIIDVDNIVNLCSDLLRKFPKELLEAENNKWVIAGNTSIYAGLLQTGSLHQIQNWLSIRMPIIDSYFNYTA